jgi:hypothetical protein
MLYFILLNRTKVCYFPSDDDSGAQGEFTASLDQAKQRITELRGQFPDQQYSLHCFETNEIFYRFDSSTQGGM